VLFLAVLTTEGIRWVTWLSLAWESAQDEHKILEQSRHRNFVPGPPSVEREQFSHDWVLLRCIVDLEVRDVVKIVSVL
jgi:hypothetical protein